MLNIAGCNTQYLCGAVHMVRLRVSSSDTCEHHHSSAGRDPGSSNQHQSAAAWDTNPRPLEPEKPPCRPGFYF